MKTMKKSTNRELVRKYIEKYPPYDSVPLGVNVSEIIKIAREKQCSIKELKAEDIKSC